MPSGRENVGAHHDLVVGLKRVVLLIENLPVLRPFNLVVGFPQPMGN